MVQKLVFEGRYHWQAAHVAGEGTNGQNINEDYTEVRRFRMGAKIGFLTYFTYKGVVNLVDDQRFNGGGIGDIQLPTFAPVCRQSLANRRRARITCGGADDPCAERGKLVSDRSADASTSASDKCNFSF